ncbi:acetyl-CoA carboxylase biotin carboxyl carrier protein [Sphingosinicella sp.]|uniref:acetyl-CoA carboxylase biotin carboxyl carrier protein n=1 Tax=Sphingosinicella sp. TaxID=1917971 RepID=UPI0017A567FF|nr:acetyl-CoA carboxylase biotin carboxyl carrier protein [Sphingosinicella sp.]MBA4759377.1 acetyl-CoA carboxylase biotin carboxyl carrier protein [Sphingosinicella sp.]MEA3540234.1 acetyl-CoA carboxylase biotin carboxyl carrier protein [Pseudomonadota bacterium]
MNVDTKLVRQLAELLDETGLTEIEVEDEGRRIRVARQVSGVVAAAPVAAAPAAPAAAPVVAAPVETDLKSHPGAVKSPMVGTVYLSSDPSAPPFVKEGSSVSAGDTLLIVEAMKVMNPIVAPKSGTVVKICVANEQPVEYDQPLVVIE